VPPPASAKEPAALAQEPEAAAKERSGIQLFDSDCDKPDPYMHATKAPVMPVRPCKKSDSNAKQAP
jgi:hypothetical protein